jgi:hypothetical protein
MRRFSFSNVFVLLGTLASGCAVSHLTADLETNADTSGGNSSMGGTQASGGTYSASGATSSGASTSIGATTVTGGTAAIGGSYTSGGATSNGTGGTPATGGTNSNSTVGAGGTGGTSQTFVIDTPTGGATGNGAGGTKSTGGITSTGGIKATGGSSATGGTPGTGGVIATGGAGTGGRAQGGTVASGGAGLGGDAQGGTIATGGAGLGGDAQGGTVATGGVATGGVAPTGGTWATGGAATGGVGTGGTVAATGGTNNSCPAYTGTSGTLITPPTNGFEANTTNWILLSGTTGSVSRVTNASSACEGSSYLSCDGTKRSGNWDGPSVAVLSYLVSGHTYAFTLAARFTPQNAPTSAKPLIMSAEVACTSTSVTTGYTHVQQTDTLTTWVRFSGTLPTTLTNCTSVSKVIVYLETLNSAEATFSIDIDDFRLIDTT